MTSSPAIDGEEEEDEEEEEATAAPSMYFSACALTRAQEWLERN